MARERIGFQGEPGAYSHLACKQARPHMQPVPYPSFEETFAALRKGEVERAMIPIENPSGGRVADIHNLLPDSGLYIVDEHFQAIQHHLLALPGASLDDIKSVRSHVQALSQCRRQLRQLGLSPVATADTAGAAKQVAADGDPQKAAIASRLAGEIYGLSILRSHIEDHLENTTRFVLMADKPQHPASDRPCMSSIFFQVRSRPAALYKALGGFATNGVNITKLESYIVDSSFTVARFYAEFEGHVDSPQVGFALEELRFYSSVVTILGVYPAHPFRALGKAGGAADKPTGHSI
ncbi:MAG: prephenate dehydratase [Ectothiorhodospiraceae bacterium AqS1]|nr:prephenate dehydratase [Ectothiorhodospiraceae bacterium AqS1]MBF2761679.1 prephenate dehydratase [Ectothiorhodospiraceae bacterium AqS1]